MTLRLVRQPHTAVTTFGVLFVDGFFQCVTLENSLKIIPAGTYEFEYYNSPKHKKIVPLLKNVPNRSMIEIHIANWAYELQGCIAVGTKINETMLTESEAAFTKLMKTIYPKPGTIRIEEWA